MPRSRPGSSALRRCDTYPWTMFAAESGGDSPQSSSISRSSDTTSFACTRSSARTARCFAPPSGKDVPFEAT